MLSQRWHHFIVCSASNEIRSAYAQHIFNDVFEMGSNFLLCLACAKIVYLLAKHAWKLVTCWLSMRENWLLFGWAHAEIGYSLAEHTRKFVFAYAQHAFGCPCKKCQNLNAGWTCAKIRSAYAQCAMKLFPCMHSVYKIVSLYVQQTHDIIFETDSKNPN